MKRNSKGQFVKVLPEKRFWDKVKKTKNCWEWTGSLNSHGYGIIYIEGKNYRAHRFVLEMQGKKLKVSDFVCHHCDNPKCVKPDHLFIGSQKENLHDMISKNRNDYLKSGAKHPRAKLTEKQIEEIRNKYVPYKYSSARLAKEYGVAQQTISKIILRQKYAQGQCYHS